MDLETIPGENLRAKDLFYDPATATVHEFRTKSGKHVLSRPLGTDKIQKTLVSQLRVVLRLVGDLDSYQVIELADESLSLFNLDTGEIFYLDVGDAEEDLLDAKKALDAGQDVRAEVFEYEETKVVVKLTYEGKGGKPNKSGKPTEPVPKVEDSKEVDPQVSEAELARVRGIEEQKSKRRAFGSSPSKQWSPTSREKREKHSPPKTESPKQPSSAKKPEKPVETPEPKSAEPATKSGSKSSDLAKILLIEDCLADFKGMGKKTVETLKSRFNITTVEQLARADPKELSTLPRVSLSRVEEWQATARKLLT